MNTGRESKKCVKTVDYNSFCTKMYRHLEQEVFVSIIGTYYSAVFRGTVDYFQENEVQVLGDTMDITFEKEHIVNIKEVSDTNGSDWVLCFENDEQIVISYVTES